VELGTHAKCGVEGVGTVRFELESGGFSEGRKCVVCPRVEDEFALSLSSGGQGLCIFVPERTSVHAFRGS